MLSIYIMFVAMLYIFELTIILEMASWQEIKTVLMLDTETGAGDIKIDTKDPFVKRVLSPCGLV